MPAPTKKTEKLIREVVELHKKGGSAREIGEALGLEHTTVTKWLRDMNLEPNGGAGARKRRKREKPTKDEKDLATRAATIAADTASGFTAIDAARQNVAEARQMLKEVRALYVQGKASAQQVKGADDLHDKAMRALAELEAKAQVQNGPSPNDAFTREAAQIATAKIRKLVEKARQRFGVRA